ncbi:MAG: permease-like cell division protein FtsX [Bacteroidales bacterium]|jgi:cell division transport system permease protein|nr:permease-like cell division protein FtsX [Bacteroidales bacterium]MDD2687392.1 permease-like cell division protein FtsX [Bacteroidales bacterium]MDD3329804.1 permease-like cell division protein FtsX [Bacteroidales bacterium]MDD3690585.1 permease-like cell division protein FtsX [Bacteroidales bacterium]MDD4044049.1 permease-like cell division protein FtsX [Bacteroidales bacterium]
MTEQIDKITKYRLASSWISTVLSITLVLFMIGLLGVIIINAQRISEETRENISFEIMLLPDTKQGDILAFQKRLEAEPYVKSARFISKEEATQETINMLGHDFREIVGDILPPSILLKIHSQYTSIDSLEKIEKAIHLEPNVTDIQYQRTYVENINENIYKISLIMLIISAVFLIIAITLINNTIRLSIYSKRFLIKSMLLVGAKRMTIQKPFIFKGIMQGIWASIFAILILGGVIYVAYTRIPGLIEINEPLYYGYLFGILILIGVFFTWLSTFFSVRKYIKMKIDKLYF